MDNHYSGSNLLVSTVTGVVGGLYGYMQNSGFQLDGTYEIFKVISYSFIGGVVGQIGRTVVIYIWEKLKEKSKDVCK